ncbi:MAG TPA: VCBS repeat-containing protein, partial [Acidobacteriota bacterium]|nr:VCBS repeat-containing protein [Acidobacteriota bacterium]
MILFLSPILFVSAGQPAAAPHPEVVRNPWINLKVRRALEPSSLAARSTQPLSLTSADFDEDGMPDLITGYESPGGGIVVLRSGNVDAVYSNKIDAPPFLAASAAFDLPEAPDLLGAGDFDADGHFDIVTAKRGSNAVYWLPGDGKGGFGPAQRIDLPGAALSMVCGEINRMDGLADVIVGVDGKDGAEVLVFEAPDGALQREPEEIVMPAPPVALALGHLDDSLTFSLAVAVGSDVAIVHGRDRKLTQLAQFRESVERPVTELLHIGSPVMDLQVGMFSQAGPRQLALLTQDGQIRMLKRNETGWKESNRYHAASPSAGRGTLVKSWTAPLPWESLIALDSEKQQL